MAIAKTIWNRSRMLILAALAVCALGTLPAREASAQLPAYVPVYTPAPAVSGYATEVRGLFGRRLVYHPVVSYPAPAFAAAPAPVTTYYAPAAPAVVAAPVTSYYAPAPVVVRRPVITGYYAPATVVRAPVVTYYPPVVLP